MTQRSLATELARPMIDRGWETERYVRIVAGLLVLASAALTLLDVRWLWLTAFVGVNLLQSGFSGWCLMSNLLPLLGVGKTRP